VTSMRTRAEQYLAMRRSLGYRLVCQGRLLVDFTDGVLHVTGKYDKVRLVPLHATTTAMLVSYASLRDRLCPVPQGTSFFITCTGRPVPDALARRTFWKLLDRAGICTPPGRRPRIHDLRYFLPA
jgi:integrase/recombinase XerD